ncbi:GNAT family N-acetyltransferase [Caenispirillum salinarum]
MRIESFRPAMAPALTEVYGEAVSGIGPRDYSPEQVAAWACLAPTAERFAALYGDGRFTAVAVEGAGHVLGFTDMEDDGHIGFLYCRPEVAGTGVAARLFEAVEAEARARGLSRLYSEASEAACRFFLRRGFRVLRRRDLEISGTPIHNFAVEKTV